NASVGGALVNAGHITTNPSRSGIRVTGNATVSGGISNSGVLSVGQGIILTQVGQVGTASTGGGITNSGTIIATHTDAMRISNVGRFYGGISNSGTMSGGSAISVARVASFAGGIGNSGTISVRNGEGIQFGGNAASGG